jgi:hypothetical protein
MRSQNRAVVDGLRLRDLAVAPAADDLRRSQLDTDGLEVGGALAIPFDCREHGRTSYLVNA